MKVSLPKLESKVIVQQLQQTDSQPISNAKDELIKKGRQDKITLGDITMQQGFWDKAVLS